ALDPGPGEYEIEDFIDGVMYHCDAVIQDGEVLFAGVGEYHARPGDYHPGGMAGSLIVSSGPLHDRIVDFNRRVVAALGIISGVPPPRLGLSGQVPPERGDPS